MLRHPVGFEAWGRFHIPSLVRTGPKGLDGHNGRKRTCNLYKYHEHQIHDNLIIFLDIHNSKQQHQQSAELGREDTGRNRRSVRQEMHRSLREQRSGRTGNIQSGGGEFEGQQAAKYGVGQEEKREIDLGGSSGVGN